MPRDSLLYNSDDVTKLRRMRFQVTMHWTEELPTTESKGKKPQSSHTSGEVPSSTSKDGEPSKSRGKSPWAPSPKTSTDSPSRKSSCHNKCSPPSKECHGTHDKDCHGSSSNHHDKSHSDRGSKDKENRKSPQKRAASPPQMSSSTTWAEKEPHLEGPSMVFCASSQSHQLSKTDDQFSFVCPTSTSTPNKMESGFYALSTSSDSRHSMTPLEMGLSRSFSIQSYAGVCHGSITPVTSVTRSQQVTSSGWQPTVPFSPLTLQGMDTLSTEQAAEVYQFATECQALGSDIAKWFQTPCRLEAMHHTAATTHKTVLSGCVAHSTTYGVTKTIQKAEEQESTLHGLCEEAVKAWKVANDVIFSHLLKYDSKLAIFLTSAEDTQEQE